MYFLQSLAWRCLSLDQGSGSISWFLDSFSLWFFGTDDFLIRALIRQPSQSRCSDPLRDPWGVELLCLHSMTFELLEQITVVSPPPSSLPDVTSSWCLSVAPSMRGGQVQLRDHCESAEGWERAPPSCRHCLRKKLPTEERDKASGHFKCSPFGSVPDNWGCWTVTAGTPEL